MRKSTTVRTGGLSIESSQKTFSLRQELAEREHAEPKGNRREAREVRGRPTTVQLVREGFGEYEIFVDNYAQRFARSHRLNHIVQEEVCSRVNGKLRTFVSEFRAFLDCTESYLKKSPT
jgi:hypothetical protein